MNLHALFYQRAEFDSHIARAFCDLSSCTTNVTMLSKDAAPLAYEEILTGTFNDQPMPTKPFYYSALYVNRNGKWLASFFHATLAQ